MQQQLNSLNRVSTDSGDPRRFITHVRRVFITHRPYLEIVYCLESGNKDWGDHKWLRCLCTDGRNYCYARFQSRTAWRDRVISHVCKFAGGLQDVESVEASSSAAAANIRQLYHHVIATIFRSFSAGTNPVLYQFLYGLCEKYRGGAYRHPSEVVPPLDCRQLSEGLRNAGQVRLSNMLMPLRGQKVTIMICARTIRGIHWVVGLIRCPQLHLDPIPVFLEAFSNHADSYSRAGSEAIVVAHNVGAIPEGFGHDGAPAEFAAFAHGRVNNYQRYLPNHIRDDVFFLFFFF